MGHRLFLTKVWCFRCLGLGAIFATRLIIAAPATVMPQAPVDTSKEWAIYRGDRALRGVATARLPAELTRRWSFATDGPIKSSPVIGQGRVWIGSDDGRIYALDLYDGRKIWSYQTQEPVEAPPTRVGDMIVVGSTDTYLYALDAVTGDLKWKYQTGGKIVGAANWAALAKEGRQCILVGSYDNRLHCVEAISGKPLWTYEAGQLHQRHGCG